MASDPWSEKILPGQQYMVIRIKDLAGLMASEAPKQLTNASPSAKETAAKFARRLAEEAPATSANKVFSEMVTETKNEFKKAGRDVFLDAYLVPGNPPNAPSVPQPGAVRVFGFPTSPDLRTGVYLGAALSGVGVVAVWGLVALGKVVFRMIRDRGK